MDTRIMLTPSNEITGTRAGASGGGLFITLEGPDGGGKSTQAKGLVEWLRSEGFEVTACRDPGGTDLGDRIRPVLLERTRIDIAVTSEMLLYMASRAQLVAEIIRPALHAGNVVVCDRFLLSNVVYQGYAGELGVEDVWQVGKIATGGLVPDLTLLIDIPIELASTRVGKSRDRLEDRSLAYKAKVREGYLATTRGECGIPADYHSSIRLIDGTLDQAIMADLLRAEVRHALAKRAGT